MLPPVDPAVAFRDVQRRILLIAFVESFVTTLVERGIYFYTCHALGFDDRANLRLALVFGLVYAAVAAVSHRLAGYCGEQRLLAVAIGAQFGVALLMAAASTPATVVAGTIALGGLYGLKWPVIESYMLAGDTPAQAVRSVGRFSMAWSIAVPLGLAAAGPLIDAGRAWLFVAAVLSGLPTVLAMRGLGFAAGPGVALLGGALGWGAAGAVSALAMLVTGCAVGALVVGMRALRVLPEPGSSAP